jgi:hypothetical protein
MNKLIGLMIWVLKRRFLEAFTAMVSTSPHPFNKKVSCPSFRVTTLSHKYVKSLKIIKTQ